MSTDRYSDLLRDAENRRIFEQESLAAEATELISELMELGNIKKADLARKIGKSKAFVTQVLSGSRNMTVHTFADLAFALGHRIELDASPMDGLGEMITQQYTISKSFIQYQGVQGKNATRVNRPASGPTLCDEANNLAA